MNATTSKAKGAAKEAIGGVEAAAGSITGDTIMELEGRIRDFAGAAERTFGDAVDMGEEAVGKVRDFVEQEPWKAVAIAGVVGLLVGLAARR